MNNFNQLYSADGYKYSHWMMYPENVVAMAGYAEPRAGNQSIEPMMFGLQAYIKKYLMPKITAHKVKEADALLSAMGLPFNFEGFMDIATRYNGYAPIKIYALQEGTVVPHGVPMVQVVSEDPKLNWYAEWVETQILRAIWYGSTVAGYSKDARNLLDSYAKRTVDDKNINEVLAFQLHDFGARGTTCSEQASIGGAAHLVNFMGTDTIEAIPFIRDYYNTDVVNDPPAYTIPATEHSVMTAYGPAGEGIILDNLIKMYGDKIFAVVGDTYDMDNFVENIIGTRKEVIEKMGGRMVVRPDSGDPVLIVCRTVLQLDIIFGSTTNSKGYKVLAPCVRVIHGDLPDGTNDIRRILEALKTLGYSSENLAFGMGGKLLQKHNRDDCRFAMKANAIKLSDNPDNWVGINKNPKTDPTRASKKGLQAVIETDDLTLKAIPLEELGGMDNKLQLVYDSGALLRNLTFQMVREVAQEY